MGTRASWFQRKFLLGSRVEFVSKGISTQGTLTAITLNQLITDRDGRESSIIFDDIDEIKCNDEEIQVDLLQERKIIETARTLQSKMQIGTVVQIVLSEHVVSGSLIEIGCYYLELKPPTGPSINISLNKIDITKCLNEETLSPSSNGLQRDISILDDQKTEREKVQTDENCPESLHAESSQTEREDREQNTFSNAKNIKNEVSSENLNQIETYYNQKIYSTSLPVIPPDLSLPLQGLIEKNASERKQISNQWSRVKNKYEYAKRNKELTSQSGKVHSLIEATEELEGMAPEAPEPKRYLAYFYYLLQDTQQSLKWYLRASKITYEKQDLSNIAVLSIEKGDLVQASLALERFFQHEAISQNLDVWYVFVWLLQKQKSYVSLKKLHDALGKSLSLEEEELLLKTGIYFLIGMDKKPIAQELLDTFLLRTHSTHSLITRACSSMSETPLPTLQGSDGQISQREQAEKSNLEFSKEKASVNPSINELLEQAEEHARSKDYSNAIAKCKRAVEANPNHQKAQMMLRKYRDLREKSSNVTDGVTDYYSLAKQTSSDKESGINPSINELLEQAEEHARSKDYSNAIAKCKRAVEANPNHQKAQTMLRKYRDLREKSSNVTDGVTDYYSLAKQTSSDDEAIDLLYRAIEQNQMLASAAKNLANLLAKSGKDQEAINVLLTNRPKLGARDQKSVDNVLYYIYIKARRYPDALTLLKRNTKNVETLNQMATCYMRLEEYRNAANVLYDFIRIDPNNRGATRRLAYCLIMLECYEEAENLLRELLQNYPNDNRYNHLLNAVINKDYNLIDKVYDDSDNVNPMFLDSSGKISVFAEFFLKQREFEGLALGRQQEDDFNASHIEILKGRIAGARKAKNHRDLAEFFLTAARIARKLIDEGDLNYYDDLYTFLFRSFLSRGDFCCIERKPPDTIRDWYCEALHVYEGISADAINEQDAFVTMIKFLHLSLGRDIDVNNTNYDKILLEEMLTTVKRQEMKILFEAITYLASYSKRSVKLLVQNMGDQHRKNIIFNYLTNKYQINSISESDIVILWETHITQFDKKKENICTETSYLHEFEYTTAFKIEGQIKRIENVKESSLLKLDQKRCVSLLEILQHALRVINADDFIDRESSCLAIQKTCKDLLDNIKEEPTILSIEQIYPVVETIQLKTTKKLEELYDSSLPQVTLKLLDNSYIPNEDYIINVRIAIESEKREASPVEALELTVYEEEEFFTCPQKSKYPVGSLRGGHQKIEIITIRVTEQAQLFEAFSLQVCAKYRIRSGENHEQNEKFPIRLDQGQFEEIYNPYAEYAEGKTVKDKEMFYGRKAYINRVANVISGSLHGKSFVIYGQKRAGKSSILYHLKMQLEKDPALLILDLGDIGAYFDKQSSIPLFYRILWRILDELKYVLEEREEMGYPSINIESLKSLGHSEFYRHPSPLDCFREILRTFWREAKGYSSWLNIRVVVLMDEFSYLYDKIIDGTLSRDFMKNLKSFLHDDFFSVILVSQDVMAKFKNLFPNEFGTMESERVSYLEMEEAFHLIEDPIRIGGKVGETRYLRNAKELIYDLTAGSPFYIQIICKRLVEHMNYYCTKYATEADVEKIRDNLIRGVNSLSLDKFDNLTDSEGPSDGTLSRKDTLRVLSIIASASRTTACKRSEIICEEDVPIDDILKDLLEREVISCDPGSQYYRIRVGIFREWLVHHPQ